MNHIVRDLNDYFLEVLGIRPRLRAWKEKAALPVFLIDRYDFYETVLMKKPCLFMVVKEGADLTPTTLRKHWELVLKKWEGLCVVVQEAISTYNRKRLIEHKVPFVIPGTQLFLPDLGMDLKERFQIVRHPVRMFSPATQAVVIYTLLNKIKDPISAKKLVERLGYTQMTISRVFNEFEETKIGTIVHRGRERLWSFNGTTEELWELVQPFLKSPVKMRVWVKRVKFNTKAGLNALAYYTMLQAPPLPVYAISLEEWKKAKLAILPNSEEAACEVEVWYYDPLLFAKQNTVDRYSLYLSLRESQDERIEKALEELWS